MGDVQNNDGTGHYSVYNNKYVKDEIKDNLHFCESGVVALANKGPDTNGSQFFITLDELPYLNNKYTIIGQVVLGFSVLKKIAELCGTRTGKSKCDVKISKTGIYNYQEYMVNKKAKF